MAPARIFLAVGAAAAAGELVLAVLLRDTELGAFFLACATLTIIIAVATRRLLARPGDDADDEDEGGGGPPRPDDDPPPWWPEFESRLREWEREQDRARV